MSFSDQLDPNLQNFKIHNFVMIYSTVQKIVPQNQYNNGNKFLKKDYAMNALYENGII